MDPTSGSDVHGGAQSGQEAADRTTPEHTSRVGRGAWGVGRGAWGVGRGAWGVGAGVGRGAWGVPQRTAASPVSTAFMACRRSSSQPSTEPATCGQVSEPITNPKCDADGKNS